MRHLNDLGLLLAGLVLYGGACASDASEAADDQVATLRIDLVHTGSATEEEFAVDELILEGPWPGAPRPVGQPELGPYFFEIRNALTDSLLFTDGFASIFDEWRSTAEAKDTALTFEESLRVPQMVDTFTVSIFRRVPSATPELVWEAQLDPTQARKRDSDSSAHVWSIIESGPPSDKIDLLLLGDGYTAEEMEKWHADARRLADTLFSYEPFASRRSDFNVRAIDSPSEISGIANPSADITHTTALGATYDSFGMERYVLTFSNKKWRSVAAVAPYEFVIIAVNNVKYGGAGIYNLFSTVSVDNDYTAYVLVHEFGHHFAGLGDEYYNSFVTYESDEARPEPWAPNITSQPENPKWKDLVLPSTPLPTPWPKSEYEALEAEIQSRRRELREHDAPESEVSALFRESQRRSRSLLGDAQYVGAVGAFEGALYVSSGYYRPEIDCIMFTRDKHSFCRVCERAIEQATDKRTKGPK